MVKVSTCNSKNKLNLGDLLRMLVNSSKLNKADAEKLYKDRKLDSSKLSPIVGGARKGKRGHGGRWQGCRVWHIKAWWQGLH